MVRNGTIRRHEIEFVVFEIVQVFKNEDIQNYLKWLDGEFETHGKLGAKKRESTCRF